MVADSLARRVFVVFGANGKQYTAPAQLTQIQLKCGKSTPLAELADLKSADSVLCEYAAPQSAVEVEYDAFQRSAGASGDNVGDSSAEQRKRSVGYRHLCDIVHSRVIEAIPSDLSLQRLEVEVCNAAERRACLTEQQRETAQLIGKRGWRCISEAPGHAVVRHSGTEMDYPCAGAERREALPQRGGLSRRTLGKGQTLLFGRLCAEALGELFRAEIYDRMIGSKGIQLGAWVVYHRSHLIKFCVEHCRVYPERLAAAAYRR